MKKRINSPKQEAPIGSVWELSFAGNFPSSFFLVIGTGTSPNPHDRVQLLDLEAGHITYTFETLMLDEEHGRWKRFS